MAHLARFGVRHMSSKVDCVLFSKSSLFTIISLCMFGHGYD